MLAIVVIIKLLTKTEKTPIKWSLNIKCYFCKINKSFITE